MSPVFLVSVIDFLMSLAVDTAHGGVAIFPFQTVSNSWSNCVGMNIYFTDTPMHSFMGGVTVHTAPLSTLPPSHALIVDVICVFFLFSFLLFFLIFNFSNGMTEGEMRLNLCGIQSTLT